MDEFARLRHKIYRERTGNPGNDWANSVRQLGRVFFGSAARLSPVREVLAAAVARGSPAAGGRPLPGANAGRSPYLDRYLADAEQAAAAAGAGKGFPAPRVPPAPLPVMHRVPSDPLDHPVRVVQCMFYGDPSRSGRGSSGGIGTLLKELGSAMAKEVGGVVTLVLYDACRATYALKEVERIDELHSIVRVPVCLSEEPPLGFLLGHEELRRAVTAAFAAHNLHPQIVHVRYLDDASLAVAREVESMSAKLVVTFTPDPHRHVCDENGALREWPAELGFEYFNKVLIGDELLARADGVVPIGRNSMETGLLPYYPPLEDTRGRIVQAIDEGVRITAGAAGVDAIRLFTETAPVHKLAAHRIAHPILLCVGRLAGIKNQVELVRAWARQMWRTHNLVLIGGDLDNPSDEEADILRKIAETVADPCHLSGAFCHLGGTPNGVIRAIQAQLAARRPRDGFDVYVCPSLKEEFGLSILEAMAAGMIVCAPMQGGAPSYIRHGINGFLVDTRDEPTLEQELRTTVIAARISAAQIDAIRTNARETVRSRYSVERISHEFAGFYRRVIHG